MSSVFDPNRDLTATDEELAAAIAAHAKEHGNEITLDALADAWSFLAKQMGRQLPAHIRAAAELAGRDDVLEFEEGKLN